MIRDARAEDAAAVAAIWNPVIRDTAFTFNAVEKTVAEVAQMIAARQGEGHAFLVAEEEGRVAGFASYAQFRGGVGYARTMEHTVILAPGAWGQGTGRALMATLEARARAAGVHAMIGGVSAENPAGRAFHARIGYAEVAVLPQVGHKFGRYMDLVLMQKILT